VPRRSGLPPLTISPTSKHTEKDSLKPIRPTLPLELNTGIDMTLVTMLHKYTFAISLLTNLLETASLDRKLVYG